MTDQTPEEKAVFGIAATEAGQPIAIIGIPEGAWDHMKEGKTHTFDLTALGFPVQIMLFGAKDHQDAMQLLTQGAEAAGAPITDLRKKDFSIKDEGK
ncbi:hypothetical protein [uncultured Sulfitobacter sp.]|uniref:hypothetical protein n=1 Tax=uncultured Sulfitobacter sp. TaxID=191468 RepID=UPI0025936505|nr:hypothetical protein [uncultured Sulfitobacter sp.]